MDKISDSARNTPNKVTVMDALTSPPTNFELSRGKKSRVYVLSMLYVDKVIDIFIMLILDSRAVMTRSITGMFRQMHPSTGTGNITAETFESVPAVEASQAELINLRQRLKDAESEAAKARSDAMNLRREKEAAAAHTNKETEKVLKQAEAGKLRLVKQVEVLNNKLEKFAGYNVKAKQSAAELVLVFFFWFYAS